jgi:hypothetical protein
VATCRFDGVDESDWLYHNNGNSNHWFKVRLTGTLANRAAIGAVVRVRAVIGGSVVWQMREVSAQSGHCGQNDIVVHFGIGEATGIDSLVIDWPSASLGYYTGLPADTQLHVVEGTGIVGRNDIDNTSGELLAFPNPSTGEFNILSGEKGFLPGDRLILSDRLGRIVWQQSLDARSLLIELNLEVPAGSYQLTQVRGEIRQNVKVHVMGR